MTRRIRWRVIAAPLCVAIALASVSIATSANAAVPSQARGIDGKTIKIASVAGQAQLGDIAKGVKARVDQANADKELPGGYTLEYGGLIDDKGTADGALAANRQAVEQDGVFALVGAASAGATPEYVNQQHVPVVGWGTTDAYCNHGSKQTWYLFGINGCLNQAGQAPYVSLANQQSTIKVLGKPAKQIVVAAISEDSDAAKTAVNNTVAGSKALGMKVSYAKSEVPSPPAVVSDWSPYVQAILTSNGGKAPDVIFPALQATNQIAFQTALRQAGYTGMIVGTLYSPLLVKTVKDYTAQTGTATPEATNASMQEIVTTLTDAGVTSIASPALVGYFSADLFIKILKKTGVKNLTPENFQKVASTFKYSIPGVIGPTQYPQGWAAPSPCNQLSKSDGTVWTVAQPYACYDLYDTKSKKIVKYTDVNASKAS